MDPKTDQEFPYDRTLRMIFHKQQVVKPVKKKIFDQNNYKYYQLFSLVKTYDKGNDLNGT